MEKNSSEQKMRWFGIPKLWPYLQPYRIRLVIMFVFGFAESAIQSFYPLFNRYALDHFVGEKTLDTLPVFIISYILMIAVQAVFGYTAAMTCGKVEMWTDRDLRNAAFGHLQTLSFSYFNQNAVGYIHARVMSDTGMIGEMVSWRMMEFIWSGAYLLSVLAVMLFVNIRLALCILLLIPAAAVLMVYFERKLLAYNRKIREINSKITGSFNEGITGARSVKAMHIEEKMIAGFYTEIGNMRRTAVREAHYSALLISTVTMMSSLALALVLWQGGRLTRENLMLIGTLSVFMSYAIEMLEPIQNIIATFASFVATRVNIERFTKLMAERSDVNDSPEVIQKYGDMFRPKKENWEPLLGEVEFKDVSFRYPDGDEFVLTHFDLHVPQGTKVALVGETGAGKSTLVSLVCRFFEPTEGAVLIDGRDVRERSQLWLHSSIGYVLQTPHLFAGSVRENLRYGKPDASDEEIMEALRLVHAEGVLGKMKGGLDADVGEGGDLLSTGEKQLLSFARAILADPRILILDEATSSVDTVTEKAIQEAIGVVTEGRTSFVIAHRLSTIVNADVILVVKDGKIIGKGTHRELMRQKGYYFDLYTKQYEELAWSL